MANELQISTRGIEMPSSPIRKLAPLAYTAEDKGVKIYRLNIGQPDIKTPQKALDALRNVDRSTLEYSPSQGYRSLRQALVNYYDRYQIKLTADDIIITSGGSEAVLFAFMSCLNPGDEIIVPEPAYANYMSFAISAGAVIRTVTTTIEEGFCLPKVEKFEELINERTKAILICNPNNPTGYLYTQKEMNQIRDLVKKYNLYFFSDEVYREFIYTGSPYISAMHLEGIEQNVVLIDSVSKRYSECGIRIGALITKNDAVRKTVMKFCQARLSPPLIGQIVAEASIEGTEAYSREVYEEYTERRKCLIDGVNRIDGCYTPIPMGAFYTVAKLPVDDTEKFCAWCLSEFVYKDELTPTKTVFSGKEMDCIGETIMMAPAAGFYTNPELGRNQVRLAYVLCKKDLQRALLILQNAIEEYNKK
ncbi:pyridoxal phosphate-dependent aminotransferase [Bacteroides ovatus]|jgi:aspartate aminotransferase|uniref:pyridoxal phosphate-dependent aminotransferase n=1 Tax=Bacteroides ovatus TaxID=28116 RepID=UPI001898F62E|nr:pyridoxal phosphate-dependent aminotransferase [Bacteroides ovatus]MDC2648980.1 pyridoxal phosphate-dependent aminotransferase [Bacteroides ovatus]